MIGIRRFTYIYFYFQVVVESKYSNSLNQSHKHTNTKKTNFDKLTFGRQAAERPRLSFSLIFEQTQNLIRDYRFEAEQELIAQSSAQVQKLRAELIKMGEQVTFLF